MELVEAQGFLDNGDICFEVPLVSLPSIGTWFLARGT